MFARPDGGDLRHPPADHGADRHPRQRQPADRLQQRLPDLSHRTGAQRLRHAAGDHSSWSTPPRAMQALGTAELLLHHARAQACLPARPVFGAARPARSWSDWPVCSAPSPGRSCRRSIRTGWRRSTGAPTPSSTAILGRRTCWSSAPSASAWRCSTRSALLELRPGAGLHGRSAWSSTIRRSRAAPPWLAMLDPFGGLAVERLTHYWTVGRAEHDRAGRPAAGQPPRLAGPGGAGPGRSPR